MHAQESATANTPVAIGCPWSSENRLCLSSIFDMVTTLSSMGSPSSQWATRGIEATTASQHCGSRSFRIASSRALETKTMAQVPLSAGRVRTDIEP